MLDIPHVCQHVTGGVVTNLGKAYVPCVTSQRDDLIFIIYVEFIEIKRIPHIWGLFSHWMWSLGRVCGTGAICRCHANVGQTIWFVEKSQHEAGHRCGYMCDPRTAAVRFNRTASGAGGGRRVEKRFVFLCIDSDQLFQPSVHNVFRVRW